MSGAATQQTEADPPGGDLDPATVDRLARRWGWKPKEEFRGDPEKWTDAETFVQRGRDVPAVLMNRVQVMDRKMGNMEAELVAARQAVSDMSEMVRRSDERGYKRARAELLEQRDRAIETGDKATVHTIDAGLAELDASKPPPPREKTADPPKPAAQPNGGVQPEVQAFYTANPWYTTDAELRREADAIHVGLIQTRPDLTLEDNLRMVTDRMRRLFPDKFPQQRTAAPRQDPDPDPEPEPENPRRREPAAVAPAGDTGGRQRRGSGRTYDTMPAEAKSAYTRYAKMLDGKGKPLTKEEFATDYWAQFEEV